MTVKLNGPASGLDPSAKHGDALVLDTATGLWRGRPVALTDGATPPDGATLRHDAVTRTWRPVPSLAPPDLTALLKRVTALESTLTVGTNPDAGMWGDSVSPFPRQEIDLGTKFHVGCWQVSTGAATRNDDVTGLTFCITQAGTRGAGFDAIQVQLREYDPATNTMKLLAKVTQPSKANFLTYGFQYFGLDKTVSITTGKRYAVLLRLPSDAFATPPNIGGHTARKFVIIDNPTQSTIFAGHWDNPASLAWLPDDPISMPASVGWKWFDDAITPFWWSAS